VAGLAGVVAVIVAVRRPDPNRGSYYQLGNESGG
jgi:hypothetical protein